MPSRVTMKTTNRNTAAQAPLSGRCAAASRRAPICRRISFAACSMYTTMLVTSTAATSASSDSDFGVTATSASQTPSTTETSTATMAPELTAESSAARPVLRR